MREKRDILNGHYRTTIKRPNQFLEDFSGIKLVITVALKDSSVNKAIDW